MSRGIRQAIRSVLPSLVIRYIDMVRIERRNKKYNGVPLEATWDDIYDMQMSATEMLSGKGSYGDLAEKYVRFARGFIEQQRVTSIVDIGCGDFNVGRHLAPLVAKYVAMDVSAKIIDRNKKLFADLRNVEFIHGNACSDPILHADLITIRQVLQHLTNAEISRVLDGVRRATPRYVLVAEHCAAEDKVKRKNVDLDNHGYHTRNLYESGVYISDPPFSLPAKIIERIPLSSTRDEFLYVWLWDLSGAA